MTHTNKKKESELLKELKQLNIVVKVLLAIKDVPELNRLVKEMCLKKVGRKKRAFPKTIQIDGKVADLLSEKLTNPKYGDPGTPFITTSIGKTKIQNVLVDLGAAINVMTTSNSKQLALPNIRPTTSILQMVDQSIENLRDW